MSKLEYMQDLERQLSTAQQRIAELEVENKRFWAVIGSVAEHDRVFGAHIAAAMKEFDLHARTEEGSGS